MHLLKGFEVEVFTGTPQGEPLPLAPWLAAQQPGLALEPDARSIEYITPPLASYRDLLTALVEPRLRLRRLLATRGATLIPGSTLPLQGAARSFVRSDPSSAYHARIASTYGSRVVTASVHINFGLSCASHIIRACRMLRMDAAVVLALTASSPFYEGHASGYHSTRFERFPSTPEHVPLWVDERDYADWMELQLASGVMWNERHLWAPARPNGRRRPYELDRVELRIADLMLDPRPLLGMVMLLEHRVLCLLDGELPDPLDCPRLTPSELVGVARHNERTAATYGLDALLVDWETGSLSTARSLARRWLRALRSSARLLGPLEGDLLRSIEAVVDGGSEAEHRLRRLRTLGSVPAVVEEWIAEAEQEDTRLGQLLRTLPG